MCKALMHNILSVWAYKVQSLFVTLISVEIDYEAEKSGVVSYKKHIL